MKARPLKLFRTAADTLVVATSRTDARRVMLEEWGEAVPVNPVRRFVEMTTDGEDCVMMRPGEIVQEFKRGIVPEY